MIKQKPQKPQEPRVIFTQKGYQDLLEEKKKLVADRPDAVENLRKGREMGDLSENGYYKAARARLSFLDARIRRIERLIKLAKIVKPIGNNSVQVGSTVTLLFGTKEVEFTIVGGYESDPLKKTISHISPIGKALMGKMIGDTIQVSVPKGQVTYTIKNITIL